MGAATSREDAQRRMTEPNLENQLTDEYSGRRFYEWDDEQYWSVTTVIGQGLPKAGLVFWSAIETAKDAVAGIEDGSLTELYRTEGPDAVLRRLKGARDKSRDKSADIGRMTHRVAEAWAKRQPTPPVPAIVQPFAGSLRAWLEAVRPRIVATEAQVYYRSDDPLERYAGTLDLLAWLPTGPDGAEELWMIDVKTGERVYPESAIQLAAYGAGHFIGDPLTGRELELPKPDRYGILHVRPRSTRLKPVDIAGALEAFRHARGSYQWVIETSKGRIGKAIKELTATAPAEPTAAAASSADGDASSSGTPEPSPSSPRTARTRPTGAGSSRRRTRSDNGPSSAPSSSAATGATSRKRSKRSTPPPSEPARHTERDPRTGRFAARSRSSEDTENDEP
jgi:hypothetical protein